MIMLLACVSASTCPWGVWQGYFKQRYNRKIPNVGALHPTDPSTILALNITISVHSRNFGWPHVPKIIWHSDSEGGWFLSRFTSNNDFLDSSESSVFQTEPFMITLLACVNASPCGCWQGYFQLQSTNVIKSWSQPTTRISVYSTNSEPPNVD